MRIKLEYPKLIFAKQKFIDEWNKDVREAFVDSSEAFYVTVWFEVPVRTGMARGSLIPLGRALKIRSLAITPLKDWESGRPRHLYPHGKSLIEGIKMGEDAYVFETEKELILEFNITVYHYQLNERGLGNNNALWWSLPKGLEAFKQELVDTKIDDKLRALLKKHVHARAMRSRNGR